MSSIVEQQKSNLQTLCRKHHVRRLEVFGSATDESFRPETSDLDFLVDYLPLTNAQYVDAYFGLLSDLEDLFQRKIDLVVDRAIRNPYFRKGVDQSRQVIYIIEAKLPILIAQTESCLAALAAD